MTDHDGDEVTGAGRLLRTAVLLLSLGVVVCGALLVPMPVVEAAPGAVTDIGPLVRVEGVDEPIDGRLGLLTVRIDKPSMVELVRAWVDDQRDLRPVEDVIPPAVSQRTYVELQQHAFRRSFDLAAAVGLRAAGLDVELATAVQVVAVTPDGPADGHLQVGDVVRTFDGQRITSTDQLIALVQQSAVGDELVVGVERDGEVVEVRIRAGRVAGLEHPGMGVTLQPIQEQLSLPRDVALLDQRGIGGPSAGLMIALAVYDLVADEDVAGGRHVVGTGTIAADGRVGRIGSIREKTFTAIAADADLMLVPVSQAAEARRAADGRIDVVGVRTLDDALAALRG